MASQAGPAGGDNIPPGALASEATDPEPSGAQGVNQLDPQDETSQGCGQSLCCRGSERSPEQGAVNQPQVTDVAPKVTEVAPKVTDVAPKVADIAPKVTNVESQVTDDAPKVTNSKVLKSPEPDESTDSKQTFQLQHPADKGPEPALSQTDNSCKGVTVPSLTDTQMIPASDTADSATEMTQPKDKVQGSPVVVLPEGSSNTEIQQVVQDMLDTVQAEPPQEISIDEDMPDLVPSDEPEISASVSAILEKVGELEHDLSKKVQTLTSASPTSQVVSETDASTREEELIWEPLTSALTIHPLIEESMEKKMESNQALQQLMSESAQLLNDSADLFGDEDEHSDLYESDQDVDNDGEAEEVAASEEITKQTPPVIAPVSQADSNIADTEIAPASEANPDIIKAQPEPSTKPQTSTKPTEESKPDSISTNLGKSSSLSNSISSLSNVLSDGFNFLQKIGYSGKSTGSKEDVSKDGNNSVGITETKTDATISDSDMVTEAHQNDSKLEHNKGEEKETGEHKEEEGDKLGESQKAEESPKVDAKKSPTEILEKSSYAISDSLTDALNESYALLKRFGIRKDAESNGSKPTPKSQKSGEGVSREKAVHFNENLFKNYNLMLKLQRDVAKLQLHLSNMKDCVRSIDKDLEELMDATMGDDNQ